MTVRIFLTEHNGSTTVRELELTGPVPRTGEFILIPTHMQPDIEGHSIAIVSDVRYRIEASTLVAEVTAIASHDSPGERHGTLWQNGWLKTSPDAG